MRKCARCPKKFTPNRANQRYCGPDCSNKACAERRRVKPHEVSCALCGHKFETTNPATRYCQDPERGCARKARAEYHRRRDRVPRVTQTPDPPPPTYEELRQVLTRTGRLQRRINEPPHHISIRIPTAKPIAIVWSADWHIGSEGVDYECFFSDVETIAEHPGLYVVVGGDGMDLFIKQSLSHAAHTDAVSPSVQMVGYQQVIDRLGKSVLALSTGNHDEWLFRNTGIDWLRALARRKHIAFTGQGAHIALTVGRETYSIFRHHKTRFVSSFNKTHTLKRLWEFAPDDAEILVGEHKHVAALEPFVRHSKERWAVLCGTYKVYDRWAQEQGFYGMETQSPAVIFWPREHRMLGFVDFHDAVDHLRPWYGESYPRKV